MPVGDAVRVSPTCAVPVIVGAPVAAAFDTGVRVQSTLCAGSCPCPAFESPATTPVAADQIKPPLSSSEFASTATPCVEMSGSTTV